MNQVDLAFTSALEQARLIRDRKISPLELTQLYLDRIQQLDPQLGSYFTVATDRALADAKAKTEQLANHTNPEELPPFFGVPIPIKDLNAVKGMPCSYGSRALAEQIAERDDGVVMRIKQAGFTILGKTATSELGSLPYTEPDGFRPARNPWDLNYTAGGSSGGAAAALAAGLCPIAQGSDGGGSIRGPAFCCGLVGLKPSRGRVSQFPLGEGLSGLATNAPLGRTVADAAALLDVMAGYFPGDPYWLPNPDPSFLTVAQQGGNYFERPLKIAFSTTLDPLGEADAICKQAVLDAVELLESLGHQIQPSCPNFTGLVEPFIDVWQTSIAASGLPEMALGEMNRWLLGRTSHAGEYVRSMSALHAIARQIVAFFETVDVLVLPTYMHSTIQVGQWDRCSPEETLENIIRWIGPCPPFNATGQPAIAIPTGFTAEGLPVGIQLIGRPASEATIVALAAQIEAAKPWSHHRPAFAIDG